jgi:hypothetical protein
MNMPSGDNIAEQFRCGTSYMYYGKPFDLCVFFVLHVDKQAVVILNLVSGYGRVHQVPEL